MITKGNVVHHQATPAHLLYKWLVQNGRAVFKNIPKLRRGIWLVTKTYVTDIRAVALLTGNERNVTWSVNAQALGVGNVEATTGWWDSQKSEAWVTQDMVRPLIFVQVLQYKYATEITILLRPDDTRRVGTRNGWAMVRRPLVHV